MRNKREKSSKLHLCIGLMAGLAAAPLAVQAASPSPPPPQGDVNGNFAGQSRGSGLLGFLSPEQRVIFMQQQGLRNMSAEQRKSWRSQEVQKLASMSQTDRDKLKSDLQKKWDALPQAQKDRIRQRLAARMTQQNSGLR